jgi:hypothetical protein
MLALVFGHQIGRVSLSIALARFSRGMNDSARLTVEMSMCAFETTTVLAGFIFAFEVSSLGATRVLAPMERRLILNPALQCLGKEAAN